MIIINLNLIEQKTWLANIYSSILRLEDFSKNLVDEDHFWKINLIEQKIEEDANIL